MKKLKSDRKEFIETNTKITIPLLREVLRHDGVDFAKTDKICKLMKSMPKGFSITHLSADLYFYFKKQIEENELMALTAEYSESIDFAMALERLVNKNYEK